MHAFNTQDAVPSVLGVLLCQHGRLSLPLKGKIDRALIAAGRHRRLARVLPAAFVASNTCLCLQHLLLNACQAQGTTAASLSAPLHTGSPVSAAVAHVQLYLPCPALWVRF